MSLQALKSFPTGNQAKCIRAGQHFAKAAKTKLPSLGVLYRHARKLGGTSCPCALRTSELHSMSLSEHNRQDSCHVTISVTQQLEFGERLKAVGSCPELGLWDCNFAPGLEWDEGHEWRVDLMLPPGMHEFKLVVEAGDGLHYWEDGENRVVQVASDLPSGAPTRLSFLCEWSHPATMSMIETKLEEEQQGEHAPGREPEPRSPERLQQTASQPASNGGAASASPPQRSPDGGVGDGEGQQPLPPKQGQQKRLSCAELRKQRQQQLQSSWKARESGGGRGGGADYLYELGASSNTNLNIDTGQNAANLDSLFVGKFLGHKSDIADGSLRAYEMRTLNNIVGDYYVAPRFLERVAMHIGKNYLAEQAFDDQTRVPLILGIWGGKGQGKSFQTELCFKKMGVEPIIMSAGELEHEWAGTPGRLIRERYRRASEVSRVRGKLSCLLINDIDAGVGHFDNTQITVNNQIVIGTLMNICDNPTRVSIGQDWQEGDRVKRIPIIVTGNDLSRVFAPLIRDGRMDKFFWQPSQEDLVGILWQMYKDDGLSKEDMDALLNAFPGQSLDFFGALRASTYDNQIRDWIKRDVIQGDIAESNENLKELGRRLIKKEGLPNFKPVTLTRPMLMAEGERLVREQDMVNSMKLSHDYLKPQKKVGRGLIGLQG